jgi:hypothetical protein
MNMKKIKILMPFLMVILLIISCENADKNSVNQAVKAVEAVSYIDISEMYFIVEPSEEKEVDGIPSMSLLLASEGRGNISLATTPAYTPIENSEFESVGIPETAEFAFNTYYAGGGYYYYGNVEENRLKVYRKVIEEMSEEEFSFELFKTFGYTADAEIEL